MIIALILWNIVLTLALAYFAWRLITFEKMVSRFANQLAAQIQADAEKCIKITKITLAITVGTFLLTVFKKSKGAESEQA